MNTEYINNIIKAYDKYVEDVRVDGYPLFEKQVKKEIIKAVICNNKQQIIINAYKVTKYLYLKFMYDDIVVCCPPDLNKELANIFADYFVSQMQDKISVDVSCSYRCYDCTCHSQCYGGDISGSRQDPFSGDINVLPAFHSDINEYCGKTCIMKCKPSYNKCQGFYSKTYACDTPFLRIKLK